MKLALIGFGQAGGKIVDRFLEYERQTNGSFVGGTLAINTAMADLAGLELIPKPNRVLIGQSRVKGHGVGADNELGADVTSEDIDEIQRALDDVPVHDVDAFLIVAGMGGGTGSGGAPVLAKHLKRLYNEPVYGLGVLPASDEGGIYTLNAARSFQTFVREVDNLLVFDNEVWRSAGESVEGGYAGINEEIVRRFGLLFSAGEVRPGEQVAESVVDSSEIINTLGCGGVSTIGYASESVTSANGGLLSRFGSDRNGYDGLDTSNETNRITSLVRKAALGRLTLPAEIASAERALVLTSGPPERLSRKGIERGRKWIEDETGSMEVRGGDYPLPNADTVSSVVLLGGIHQVPRIKELQRVAAEAQDNIRELRAQSEANVQQLVSTANGELEPLF